MGPDTCHKKVAWRWHAAITSKPDKRRLFVRLPGYDAVDAAVVGSVTVVFPANVVSHFEPAAHLVEPRFVEFVCVLLPGFVFGCVGSG